MTIRFRVHEPGVPDRTVELDGSQGIIGRHPQNAVVLRDAKSSRRHCRVLETPQGVVLEDLGSANGTLLNGETVGRSLLEEGDEIGVGSTRIVFAPGASATGSGEAAAASSGGVGGDAQAPAPAASGPAGEETGPAWGHLACEAGPLEGQTLELARASICLGRARDNDIRLEDTRVSGRHARIVREEGGARIEDLGSKNGILVDGRRVRRARLGDGSRVGIGASKLTVRIPGAAPAPARDREGDRAGAQGASPAAATPAGAPEPSGGDGLPLARVDAESLSGLERWRQPLSAVALVVVVASISWFAIDIARRVIAEREPDPPAADNLVRRNWSFEEGPGEVEDEPGDVPGWSLVPPSAGALETTGDGAQFPGRRALRVRATGASPAAAVQADRAVVGVDRSFVLGGHVACRGGLYAALRVDWLRSGGEGERVVGSSWAPAARGPGDAGDVRARVEAPPECTQARVACTVEGPRGAEGIFDRVALRPAGGEPEEGDGDVAPAASPRLRLEAGDEGAGAGVVLELRRDGSWSLASRGRRVALRALWFGLASARDPRALGPRLVDPVVQGGDRGTRIVTTVVPDLEAGAWETVETSARASGADVGLEARRAGEGGGALVLWLTSPDPSLEVLAYGSETRRAPWREVAGSGYRELVLGTGRDRVSLAFGAPVALEAAPHPRLDKAWVLRIAPASGGRSLDVSVAPGSRSEARAAAALVREASRLRREGELPAAREALRELLRLYPEQEREADRARELLRAWKGELERVVRDLEGELERLAGEPNPVAVHGLAARLASWAERLAGTREGEEIEALARRLEATRTRHRAARTRRRLEARLARAREHWEAGEAGFCELELRGLLAEDPGGSLRAEAERLLARIESRREGNAERWLRN